MEDFNAFWDAQLVDFVHSLHVLKDSRLVKFLCFFKNFLENWLVDFFLCSAVSFGLKWY